MQNIRGLAITREGIQTTYERIPYDFYDKEVFKTKTSEHKSISEIYSQGKLVKRLRADRTYGQTVQIPVKSNAYFGVNSIKSITRESVSPLVEKIHLANGGEIELRVENGQIDIYSRKINSAGNNPAYTISKTLQRGISSEEAIRNAEAGIFNRLANLELQKRIQERDLGLRNYFMNLSRRKELAKALKQTRDKALLEHAAKEVGYNSLVEGVNEVLEKTGTDG